MEEVDSIIIDSLRSIHCDVDEEVSGLKEFTPELAFSSFVYCLRAINPEIKLHHQLPPSMTHRLKLATNIAEYVKELGYRGDMGYQTILYCNENELRRVLMFLIERVPRDNKTINKEREEGYVSKVVKQIEEKINESLHTLWVPSRFLRFGIRETENSFFCQNNGECFPLNSEIIKAPKTQEQRSDVLTNYWIHDLPFVSEQCSGYSLIPSLLFCDAKFSKQHLLFNQNHILKNLVKEEVLQTEVDKVDLEKVSKEVEQNFKTDENEELMTNTATIEEEIASIVKDIKSLGAKKNNLEKELKTAEGQLNFIKDKISEGEETLKEFQTKIHLKKKTQAVLSKQDNLLKLKKIVERGSERLVDLANQWSSVQTPLLEEFRSLLNSQSTQENKLMEEKDKLLKIQEKNKQIKEEIKDKEQLELQLLNEYDRISKNVHRSGYTKRIIEIIGNIKKQEEDIKKILNDTRTVQKSINNLNGQLERSFTLADELIFRDAKRDESARKAYKLLAALHSECSQIIETITDLGTMEREARNLQDQVDVELGRETASKLERVLYDLSEVKKENTMLVKQIKDQVTN